MSASNGLIQPSFSASVTSMQNNGNNNVGSDFSDISNCCICYETYNSLSRAPIAIPCGHTFCKACVDKVVVENTFSCFTCRTVIIIGFGGLEKNLTLIRILEKLNLLATDNNQQTTSMPKNGILEQTYHNISPAEFDQHSQNYFKLIKGYLRHHNCNIQMPPVKEIPEAIKVINVAVDSLQKCFQAFQNPQTLSSQSMILDPLTTRRRLSGSGDNRVTVPFQHSLDSDGDSDNSIRAE